MASHLMRRESERNSGFRQFITEAQLNPIFNRLSYDHFLKAPISRIQRYLTLLRAVLDNSADGPEKAPLEICIEKLKNFVLECGEIVSEETKRVEIVFF